MKHTEKVQATKELKKLQKRIANNQTDIDARNTILATMNAEGVTHKDLASILSDASGRPVVEDTVQKAIRKHRESNA